MASERLSPYATPSATREVLERHGLTAKYTLGQNFLVNDDIVKKIVELADARPEDHVLEVGPGIGTLSAALLQRAGHLTAVETDGDLPAVLADTLAPWAGSFKLLAMDALDVEPGDLAGDEPNKLVSNLPYSVAATVVLDYLQRFAFLDSATVMVQREVADRMMAKPGTKEYGAYTVKLSLFARASGRFPVSARDFFPPPRVESAVIRLDRTSTFDDEGNRLSPQDLKAVCKMVDAAFATRRKTLSNSCKAYFAASPAIQSALPNIFNSAGIDSRRRGEVLTKPEFVRLGLALRKTTSGEPGASVKP